MNAAAREKILATADALIYEHGIQATGMDLLVKTSGVARKTIYRYFATKDEVAAAALEARDLRWMSWFREQTERSATPHSRLLGMFDVLNRWFASEGFRGCAFINTAGETGDAGHPIRLIAKRHKQKLADYLLALCEQLPAPQPAALARQLLVLIDGAITVARVMGDADAARSARDVAEVLLAPFAPT